MALPKCGYIPCVCCARRQEACINTGFGEETSKKQPLVVKEMDKKASMQAPFCFSKHALLVFFSFFANFSLVPIKNCFLPNSAFYPNLQGIMAGSATQAVAKRAKSGAFELAPKRPNEEKAAKPSSKKAVPEQQTTMLWAAKRAT